MKIRLLDGSGIINLKYLYEDVDRYGQIRIYFRRKGNLKTRLKSALGSPEFLSEYRLALASKTTEIQSGSARRPASNSSLRWLIERYYDESEDYSRLDERTKYVRRRTLDAICADWISDDDKTSIGSMPFATMPSLAVKRLRDRKRKTPEAANSRLKALRQVFKFGVEQQYCQLNPTRDVPYIKTGSQGFHAWTLEEVHQFEEKHPLGTKARLALAILLYTGARRADVVQFGKQHVRAPEHMSAVLREAHNGRWLQYTQHKNRNKKPITLTLPILPELDEVLANSPLGDLTWLVTEFGNGFTAAGFGNWFRDQCNKAGLKHCSAHGLRKAGATLAAENGASVHTLKSMFGWQTLKQAENYTKSADQKRLAAAGMQLLGRGK